VGCLDRCGIALCDMAMENICLQQMTEGLVSYIAYQRIVIEEMEQYRQ
jgi:hypothetical protein